LRKKNIDYCPLNILITGRRSSLGVQTDIGIAYLILIGSEDRDVHIALAMLKKTQQALVKYCISKDINYYHHIVVPATKSALNVLWDIYIWLSGTIFKQGTVAPIASINQSIN
jgi:hypothetical protein